MTFIGMKEVKNDGNFKKTQRSCKYVEKFERGC